MPISPSAINPDGSPRVNGAIESNNRIVHLMTLNRKHMRAISM